MKDKWRVKYQKTFHLLDGNQVNVLTGFNANIDLLYNLEDLNIDVSDSETELVNPVENEADLKSTLNYCVEKSSNKEVNRKNFREEFSVDPVKRLGGQGGIMANYLSGFNNYVTFYTPLLSEELAEMINEDVVSPSIEGKLVLKRTRECVNTDRTKKNTIIQFEGSKTGRLIISDKVKGFGPYFRSGVEDNFDILEKDLDRILLSGFHNVDGNFEAKLKKAEKQLEELETPKHLEYVSMADEKALKVINDLLPKFDSIGLDESEALKIANLMNLFDKEELKMEEAFKLGKELLERKDISRCHIHTYRYHVVIASEDYPIEKGKIQRAMLFGEASAIQMAEQGTLPDKEDMKQFELDGKHLHRLDELEDFGHLIEEKDFAETGKTDYNGLKVVAIPTLVHEDPERLVGMGDVISSGAFVGELK